MITMGNIPTVGQQLCAWDNRLNLDRLRNERIQKAKDAINKAGFGAILCYDYANQMYLGANPKQTWCRAKNIQYVLMCRNGDPIMFTFGTRRPRMHEELSYMKEENIRGMKPLDQMSLDGMDTSDFFNEIKAILYEHGVQNEPLAIDLPQTTINLKDQFAAHGIKLVDGGKVMQDARAIKTQDEILCFSIAAAVSEVGHQAFKENIKPGVRECEVVGKAVGAMIANGGCMFPEAPVFVSGERTCRNHLDYSDKIIRPGELIMADPNGPMFMGYNTCYYRTYSCGPATTRQKEIYAECYELMYKAFNKIKPGNTTADVAAVWPTYEKFPGCKDNYEILEVATIHGLGLTLHEVPFADHINGLAAPRKFEPGMVGAIEYWVGRDNPREGVKIEDMFVVTETGCERITKWPNETITECLY